MFEYQGLKEVKVEKMLKVVITIEHQQYSLIQRRVKHVQMQQNETEGFYVKKHDI